MRSTWRRGAHFTVKDQRIYLEAFRGMGSPATSTRCSLVVRAGHHQWAAARAGVGLRDRRGPRPQRRKKRARSGPSTLLAFRSGGVGFTNCGHRPATRASGTEAGPHASSAGGWRSSACTACDRGRQTRDRDTGSGPCGHRSPSTGSGRRASCATDCRRRIMSHSVASYRAWPERTHPRTMASCPRQPGRPPRPRNSGGSDTASSRCVRNADCRRKRSRTWQTLAAVT